MANLHAVEPSLYGALTLVHARISQKRIAELENRIGHSFSNHDRLIRALTHSSATKKAGDVSHYERLEFLGDRVLGLCIANMLFEKFPTAREGELSVRLNALVSGNACAEIADAIGLHEFIFAGTGAKQLAGKRMKSVRADVVESLIAAIYLDGGLDAVNRFVERFWKERIDQDSGAIRDSKTALQEWAHSAVEATPTYHIAEKTGPDHDPLFVVQVNIDKVKPATGKGRSKRAAEQAAAQSVLVREGVWSLDENGAIRENYK